MNPSWREGEIEFDFSTASEVEKPETTERSLNVVDFWIKYADCTWLIEVKDPESTRSDYRPQAIKAFLKTLINDELLKQHLLPKLYGSYIHMVNCTSETTNPVTYGIVIGLADLNSADRTTLTNSIQRITNRVGPRFRNSAHWPVVEVHNLVSWNAAHPDMAITRIANI